MRVSVRTLLGGIADTFSLVSANTTKLVKNKTSLQNPPSFFSYPIGWTPAYFSGILVSTSE